MAETVERSSLDLRYAGYRVRNRAAEARLLASIAERGIEEPLLGVDTPEARLLLDGFCRYRCAVKLGIEWVPYVSCGADAAQGIASLLCARRQRSLTILAAKKRGRGSFLRWSVRLYSGTENAKTVLSTGCRHAQAKTC